MDSIWLHLLTVLALVPCAVPQITGENVAVLAGGTVVLPYTDTVAEFLMFEWTEFISRTQGQSIDNGERYNTQKDTIGDKVIGNLTITGVTLADGGHYRVISLIDGDMINMELIVLDDDINCTLANSENSANGYVDAILVTCGFTYQGKWAPVITCTGSGFENWTSTVTTTGGDVTYELTADVNSEQVSQSDVTCTAAFVDPKPEDYINDYARNIPEFTSTWTGGIIKHSSYTYTEWSGWCAKCGGCGQQKRNKLDNGVVVDVESRLCEAKRCFKSKDGRGEIRRSHRNRLIMREWRCCYSWLGRPVSSPAPLSWSKICKNVDGFHSRTPAPLPATSTPAPPLG